MRLVPLLTTDEQLLVRVIGELMTTIHRNEYGFPLGIYRPDLLPLHDYQPENDAADRLYEQAQTRKKTEVRARLFDDGFNPFAEETTHDDGDSNEHDGLQEKEGEREAETETEGFLIPAGARVSPVETTSVGDPNRVAGFLRSDLKASFVPLTYDEGFPTLPDGRPFWEKLEFEPNEYHVCLSAYLQMPQVSNGVRTIADLCAVMEANNLLDTTGFTHLHFTQKFQVLSQIYLWPLRARAYDLYKVAAYRKQQELRAIQVQEHHYSLSTSLLAKLAEYMGSDEEFWDLMTPKVGIDMLKALVAMQRLSVGLPATTPLSSKESTGPGGGGQSFEMILRTLAQQGGSQEVARLGSDNRLAAQILENPEATQLAQELIIRMTTGNNNDSQ